MTGFRVVRADDLLVLTFLCENLTLDRSGPEPKLVRVTAGQRAYVAVYLPPQHVAEQYFDLPAGTDTLPESPRPPVPTRIAQPTRLVFDVPAAMPSIPCTLEALLDWGKLTPSLAPTALPDPPGLTGSPPQIPSWVNDDQTQIELPWSVSLSPDATGRWSHATAAVTHDGVTELWHTRMGTRGDSGSGTVDERTLPAVRAVYSGSLPLPSADRIPNLTMDQSLQWALVHRTTYFGWDGHPSLPPPLRATHFILTPLGACTDLRGHWAPDDLIGVTDWHHVVSLGHDQEVHADVAGRLFPFGHRAAVHLLVKREPQPPRSTTGTEMLLRRGSLRVLEPERDFDRLLTASGAGTAGANGRLPLRRVTVTDTVVTIDPAGSESSAFVPQVGGQAFLFHCIAQDWNGRPVDLAMPMVFIPDGVPWNQVLRFREPAAPVPLRGQRIALAAKQGSGAANPSRDGSTDLAVDQLLFTASDAGATGDLPFLPYVTKAWVHLPAVDHLLGETNAVAVTLTDPAATPGQVFARLADGALPLGIPPALAGGLVAPTLAVGELSRTHGLVPPVLGDLGAARFDPRKLFDGHSAVLLGVINLVDIIASRADDGQVPVLKYADDGTRGTVSFRWEPTLKTGTSSTLQLRTTKALTITAQMSTRLPQSTTRAADPVTRVEGVLSDFVLSFTGMVDVTFKELRFASQTGCKTSLQPAGVGLEFQGALQFLNELANILPPGLFSGPVAVAVSPQGATVSSTLGLPNAAVGVFSIENIALSTHISLPFTPQVPASVRLDFCRPDRPFLVTVAMIGGGGYCSIEATTAGLRTVTIEAAVEIGGNISVDLWAVQANVHVMGGFYFHIQDSYVNCSAFLRIGGSIELLGIAGVSVEMYLALSYDGSSSFYGATMVTVSVHLLMFTTDVTLKAERRFPIPPRLRPSAALGPAGLETRETAHPPKPCAFVDLISPQDWAQYCNAFA
ncbi:hypothetical protein [Streptomyces cyanogenus]|uniref:Uncharacterized protein n=1 Tax=Streptomyces cyanogenus TaxID=80860 RepID=A0ABX7THC2_STRCY|nr:hypothetical protein [Streptomyces cyanogenus]QTD95815.1 hypothetical protein S1361_00585 [Streptomyces cyanogenus]